MGHKTHRLEVRAQEKAGGPSGSQGQFRRAAFDPARAACDATLFALANGALGVRGGIDELGTDVAAFLPLGFARRPITYHESFPGYANATDSRIPLPSPVKLGIAIDGQAIAFALASIVEFEHALDLDLAVLRRRTVWDLGGGRSLEVAVERMVPIGGGALCISTISVRPHSFAGRIALSCPIDHATGTAPDSDAGDPRINLATGVESLSRRDDGRFHQCLFGPAPGVDAPPVAIIQHIAILAPAPSADDPPESNETVERQCADGEWLSIRRTVAYGLGDTAQDDTMTLAITARANGFDALRDSHTLTVDAFWRSARLSIAGDAALSVALRLNLLHVFMSSSPSAQSGVAAKGLTGEGYEGHIFWDAESFVLPVLAYTQPIRARHMLDWRISQLDAARRNARSLSHATGALYPWRTIGGAECSSHYPTGAAQYHINADIAHAVKLYIAATGDTAFATVAAEMIFETARIWLEIGHHSDRRGGGFVIPGVTGPDEYSALVDNDYYTNALAAEHLAFASALATTDGPCAPDALAKTRARIGLSDGEVANWRRAAAAVVRLVDEHLSISPQDDGFLDKAPFPFARNDGRPAPLTSSRPLLLDHHPMHIFRHQVCKQGDVIQAHAVVGRAIPQLQKARDFAFYEPLTTHDSTLSAIAFGIVACEIGAVDAALVFQHEAAFVDIENRHRNSHHGAHMAAMAGSWPILVQGWGGMLITDDALHFRPRCPLDWQHFAFRLQWRGSIIEITVDSAGAGYRLIEGEPVSLFDHGRFTKVLADTAARRDRPDLRAVIFDLDGVLTDTAEAHCQAWQQLCDEEHLPFSRALNQQLKGVSRRASLNLILAAAGTSRTEAEVERLLARKNACYRVSIADYSPANLFDGARALLVACLHAGLRVGLASASQNARDVVKALGIADLFDCITDAATIAHGKPDPEIFLSTAQTLGVHPAACIGIEDARAGVRAINAAGMIAIGIGDFDELREADVIVPGIARVTTDLLHDTMKTHKKT